MLPSLCIGARFSVHDLFVFCLAAANLQNLAIAAADAPHLSGPGEAALSLLNIAKGFAVLVADRLIIWRTRCWLGLASSHYLNNSVLKLLQKITQLVIRYSQTLLLSSLVAPDQGQALQHAVAAAATGSDWRVLWCGLEAMYRMFTLHDLASLRNRLYYGVDGLFYSGLCHFFAFQGFTSSTEIIEASSWYA